MRAREECAAMETRPNKSLHGPITVAFRHAEHAYLRAAAEAAPSIEALLAAHPGFLPAHLLKIAQLVAAKDAAALPALERALVATSPLEASAGPRERAHLAAARAWLAREPLQAAKIYTQLATDGYGDALAVRLAQSCWYFLGRRMDVRAVAEHAFRTWSPERPGFDVVIAMTAFGAAETNDGARAEELARFSLEVEPRSPFAIHALAHALAIRNRAADGAQALHALAADWRSAAGWTGTSAGISRCSSSTLATQMRRSRRSTAINCTPQPSTRAAAPTRRTCSGGSSSRASTPARAGNRSRRHGSGT